MFLFLAEETSILTTFTFYVFCCGIRRFLKHDLTGLSRALFEGFVLVGEGLT